MKKQCLLLKEIEAINERQLEITFDKALDVEHEHPILKSPEIKSLSLIKGHQLRPLTLFRK